ncbi:reverse transcriptase domain-containing protein, partial [Tanacetum coccineum]
MGALLNNIIPNPQEEIKSITTRSGIILAGPSVPLPPLSCSSKEVGRDPKTITDHVLPKSTTRVPPPEVQLSLVSRSSELPPFPSTSSMFKKLHFNISLAEALALMLKDPGKFLLPYVFPELEKCMALADLGKFTFPANFVFVDYDVDPRVPLILGRPFLRTARALVDVYGEELILRDGDEKLIFHADSTSKYPHKHGNDGSTTSPSDSFPSLTPFKTSDSLLEEFTDELALIESFPQENDDIYFDAESDLRELEYLLNRDPSLDSSLKDNIEEIDSIIDEFVDEPSLVDSFPSEKD